MADYQRVMCELLAQIAGHGDPVAAVDQMLSNPPVDGALVSVVTEPDGTVFEERHNDGTYKTVDKGTVLETPEKVAP